MNIIKVETNNSININNNIKCKLKKNKYNINLLKKDKLTIIVNNTNCELNINIYDNFELLLYGNISNKINININLYNESELLFNKITINNNTIENININLNDYNSKINYNSTYIGSINSDIFINHNNNNTISNIVNHALGYKSDIILNIHETVENKIKNCELNQYSKVLKIDDSKTLIRPILNTRDYTVNAFHSSIISNINKEDILNLMSRGIGEDKCIKLIIEGFS